MHKNTKKKVTTHKITPPKKKSKYWLLVNIILDLSLNLNCRLRCFRSQMEPQWLRWAKCKKTHLILLVFLGIFLCGYWEIFFYFKRNQSGSETINSQSLSRCWGQMGGCGWEMGRDCLLHASEYRTFCVNLIKGDTIILVHRFGKRGSERLLVTK